MRHSFITLAFATLAYSRATFNIGEAVKTTSGTVIGQASKWQPEVSEYLGIPFAKPPEGELRWAAPQPITDSSKTINATKYGWACAESASMASQQVPGGAAATGASDAAVQKEDCLYLNIYTKPQVGEKKKAVLIWIYGGGFVYGSNDSKYPSEIGDRRGGLTNHVDPAYNGAHLANDYDVVTVAVK